MSVKTNKGNCYKITIEEVTSQAEQSTKTVEFEFQDREDLFQLIENLKKGSGLEASAATQLAVALRLLGPMMMQQRKHPLFVDFMPHFKTFMLQLKAKVKSTISSE